MMNNKIYIVILAVFIILIGLEQAKGGQSMELISPEFKDGQYIPAKFTCEGEDISPALIIKQLPEKTKSLALIVDDPDAPTGTWVHWVVFDIAPATEIKENSIPGTQGINTAGGKNYHGPCPPFGVHRYFFKLYALNIMLNLKEKVNKDQLEKSMQGHVLANAQLSGLYQKKK